jgi:UDP-galactopyranose mutase
MKDKPKNLVERSKVEVESFKALIKDMYRGFPNWQYNKMVEDVIKTQKMRDELVSAKFLLKEPHTFQGKEIELYMLSK